MNVVVVPIMNNMVIKTLASGTPQVFTGSAGTAIAMQYLAGSLLAGVAIVGGLAIVASLMVSENKDGSIRHIWKEAGKEVANSSNVEIKSILQIWKEEGERIKIKC
jgi:hypothetical protein